MAGKFGQVRKGQTFYSQSRQGQSFNLVTYELHVTDNFRIDESLPSDAGSRGSVSPGAKPPKVKIHKPSGPAPPDEPRSTDAEPEGVYR